MDLPKWAPSAVGAAKPDASEPETDLGGGGAWSRFSELLLGTVEAVSGGNTTDLVAGHRHLLVLLALGIDEVLRNGDPYEPRIKAGNVDNVLKWGMDCPDALYSGCSLRGDAGYRITGKRGTARYLGFQVMSGMATDANIVADDLELDGEGNLELLLSSQPQPGNWMPIPEGSSSLVVRQFFYDWVGEEPAELEIECLDPPATAESGRRGEVSPPSRAAAKLAAQIVALGEFLEASTAFWADMNKMLTDGGVNTFRPPANRIDIGGAAENVTVWGSWQLGDNDALLIEVTPPDCLYWSVSLGNMWWETVDYANHQSSLNGKQAEVDDDGVFRAVVAHEDPGIPNWLDPADHSNGPVIFRWLRAASEPPVPTIRVVAASELPAVLPATTRRVNGEERKHALKLRRAGVARRFAR